MARSTKSSCCGGSNLHVRYAAIPGIWKSPIRQIGEMLARWPQPQNEDAMWPCEEICDAIEEANSDDLDHGFQIGVLNSRGATWRSPLDGGDLERKEAAKYRRWAELCDIDWPRTAASLRKVADSYEFSAQREDSRAAERGSRASLNPAGPYARTRPRQPAVCRLPFLFATVLQP